MTSKRNRFYQIGFIAITMILIGLLMYMGISALHKSMSINITLNGQETSWHLKIEYKQSSKTEYKTLLCTTTANNENIVITDGVELEDDSVGFNENSIIDFSKSFDIKIHNYSNFAIKVGLNEASQQTDLIPPYAGNGDAPTETFVNISSIESVSLELIKIENVVTINFDFDITCGSVDAKHNYIEYGSNYSTTFTPAVGCHIASGTHSVSGIQDGGWTFDVITGEFKITDWSKVTSSNITLAITLGGGFTVDIAVIWQSGFSPNENCVSLILYHVMGHSYTVNTYDSTTHYNIVKMQLAPSTDSQTLRYTMGGVEDELANQGTGNPSEVVYLTGNVEITAIRYQNCILADSLVLMADGSLKPLGDIKVGEEVLSYDWETGKLIANPVIYASSQDSETDWTTVRYFVRTFDDGTVIKNAFAHRFYNVTKKAFVYLDFWEIGDEILKQDGTTAKLVSVEKIYENCTFGRITGQYGTNYFANGCLTGDRHCPADLDLSMLEKVLG